MPTCAEAFAAYDAKRQQRIAKEKRCERLRKSRNDLAKSLGVSVSTVIAVALALAGAAASGVALPAAIATALVIIGYAAIFIGVASLGALVSAIIAVIRCNNQLSKLRMEELNARIELIRTNADNQEELRKYLSIPAGG
jgi:hypothetical protein